jgi:hypothetical protein
MQALDIVRKNGTGDITGLVDDVLNRAILKADFESDDGIYGIIGMSGKKYRLFINSLIHVLPNARYLEVGSWGGSTLCSAIHNNNVWAVAIDNWSQFGGPKDVFVRNVKAFRTPGAEVIFIEADFRKVDYTRMQRGFNVYLFDGPHTAQDQYDGLAMALPCLDKQFIFIVDDWNWASVRAGTMDAIANCGLNVLYSAEIRTSLDNTQPEKVAQKQRLTNWHNGYFISVLQQPNRA